jgi:hypothetical protein
VGYEVNFIAQINFVLQRVNVCHVKKKNWLRYLLETLNAVTCPIRLSLKSTTAVHSLEYGSAVNCHMPRGQHQLLLARQTEVGLLDSRKLHNRKLHSFL